MLTYNNKTGEFEEDSNLVYNKKTGEFEKRTSKTYSYSTNSNTHNTNSSSDDSGCWWVFIFVILCAIGIIWCVNSCYNSKNEPAEEAAEEIVDVDSIQYVQEEIVEEIYLRVSDDELYFDAEGGIEELTIETNGSWRIGIDTNSWGHLSKEGNHLRVQIDENPETEDRTDYFTIKSGNQETKVKIFQTGKQVLWEISGTSRAYSSNAEGLKSLTSKITEKNECRLGAMTEFGSGILIFGDNEVSSISIPESFRNRIKAIDTKIKSLALTNSGYYCVVHGRNGWFGYVPEKMKRKLNEFNGNAEEILSVSISENGDYAIVTDEHFIASNSSDLSNMKNACEKYGSIKNVCITNKGICVVCQNGIFYNNIPSNLERELNSIDFRPDHVIFTDSGTYIITTEDGLYSCYI